MWQNHLNTKVTQGVIRDLGQSLFHNLQRQSMAFFTDARSGEIVQRITGDVQAVQSVVTSLVVSSITQIVIVVSTIGILFALDWKLAIISVLILPLFVLPVKKVSKLRKELRTETQKVRSDITSQLSENFGISGALLTRIFGREKQQEIEFTAMNQKVMDLELRLNLVGRWFGMATSTLGPLGTAIIYMYGGYSVIIRQYDAGLDRCVRGVFGAVVYACRDTAEPACRGCYCAGRIPAYLRVPGHGAGCHGLRRGRAADAGRGAGGL